MPQKANTSRQVPRTTIEVIDEEMDHPIAGDDKTATTGPKWSKHQTDVIGLIYLQEHDGTPDSEVVKIEPPKCGIDQQTLSVYMCMKCGAKQKKQSVGQSEIDIHRLKCSRCYHKAFNKIRPPKWEKFYAH